MPPKQPCVYMMASRKNGTLYIGVTSDVVRRVGEHREGITPGFTSRYQVSRLVWYELHGTMAEAIAREKALKEWKRAWKIRIIEEFNPGWKDLFEEMAPV